MMILTFSVIIIGAVFGLIVAAIQCRYSGLSIQRQRKGLETIVDIRKLIELIPQHRGMSNALLNGDGSFESKIMTVQSQIEKCIQVVEQSSYIKGQLQRWNKIKSDWSSLKSHYAGLSVPKSFQQHSDLINEVLYLLVDVANDSGVYFHKNRKCRDLTLGLFYHLPMMIELTARARGVGTGAAAQNKVIISTRIKLQFLYKRVNKSLEAIHATLIQSLKGESYQGESPEVLITEGLQPTYFFMHTLQGNILGDNGVTIKSSDYFDIGTSAITESFKLFDTLLPTIKKYSYQDELILKRQLKWLWFFGFIVTGAIAFFVLL